MMAVVVMEVWVAMELCVSLWLPLLPLCIPIHMLVICLTRYIKSNLLWRIPFYNLFFSS